MTAFRRCQSTCAALLLVLLAACSSQDDAIDTPIVREESAAPAGIYEGTMTSTATGDVIDVTAFVDSAETFMLFDETGALIASGVYSTVQAARSINWSARIFSAGTTTDEDTGDVTPTTIITTLTAQGGYDEQSSLLLSYTQSTGDSGTLSLTYDKSAYETRSDVSLVQGTWGVKDAFGSPTTSIVIDAGGGFSGSDENDCTYTGKFEVVDQHYNLYSVTLSSQCTVAATDTTSATMTTATTSGLATLKKSTTTTGASTLVIVSASSKLAVLWKLKPF